MDKIQKVLIQAGRKDLAQKYYKKVAISKPTHIISFQSEPEANKFVTEIESEYKGFIVDEPEKQLKTTIVQLFAGNLKNQTDLKDIISIAKDFGGKVQSNKDILKKMKANIGKVADDEKYDHVPDDLIKKYPKGSKFLNNIIDNMDFEETYDDAVSLISGEEFPKSRIEEILQIYERLLNKLNLPIF
jgi:polynucleotide 5'-kinase involved in rRNA processing